MAHVAARSAYDNLIKRINRFPQGAVTSDVLYKILKILFSEREAELVSLLPIKPFTAEKAARIWKKTGKEAEQILNELASRGILLDIEEDSRSVYTLPPPMAGFFEFSMMRIRNDIDQKVLAELFYQYMNVGEDFIKNLFTEGETQLGRVFVNEPALPEEISLHVLDYEKASEVIKTARHRAVGICYCRHKMEHLGKACGAPMDICMTFNASAGSLIKHGVARNVDIKECADLLQKAYDLNLVQFGENNRIGVNFICNCCGCCCEAMIAARRFGNLKPVHTTRYIPEIEMQKCTGCGQCVSVCPVEAMSLVTANDPHRKNRKTARLDEELCLGCGVCVRSCPNGSITLRERGEHIIPPYNSTHRAVMMAIERNKLQNLIFDNRAMFNHRLMSAILGAILKLPPIKQTLAMKQVKSRYLERIIRKAV
jgi:formate hydrogenlyase subunit 6/NADH:ubiquinone oxidoreductase subunit I